MKERGHGETPPNAATMFQAEPSNFDGSWYLKLSLTHDLGKELLRFGAKRLVDEGGKSQEIVELGGWKCRR